MSRWSERRLLESIATLCDNFGAQVYSAVEDDWEFFSSPGQVTLDEEFHTKTLIRSLRGAPGIMQWTFSRHGESRSGADWEWWIGSKRLGWRCARIQAKIAHPRRQNGRAEYLTLGHEVGKKPHRRRQIDLLIEGAYRDSSNSKGKATGVRARDANPSKIFVDPYYCFYNGPIRNSSAARDMLPLIIASQGCAVDLAAEQRTEVPEWAEWVRNWSHFPNCSKALEGWPWQLCRECAAKGPQPLRRHVRYWGAAVVPADIVWDRFVGSGGSTSAESHLRGALPLSTVLFTEYERLNSAIGGGGLPSYAEMMLDAMLDRRRQASDSDSDGWFADIEGLAAEVDVGSVGIIDVDS